MQRVGQTSEYSIWFMVNPLYFPWRPQLVKESQLVDTPLSELYIPKQAGFSAFSGFASHFCLPR